MDPVSIASAVVTTLSPYLGKVAGKFAEAAGGAAWTKTAELYKLLKHHLASTPAAQHALAEMEIAPDDAAKQARLSEELGKFLAGDPDFMRDLAHLVAAAGHAAPVFNNQVAGDVGKIVNIGSANDIQIN